MGNPGGFGAEFIPELMELEGDRGGKRILLAHRDEVLIFSDTKPEELEDIDYSC
jgi:molybdenum cofactor cytidylyltransferase